MKPERSVSKNKIHRPTKYELELRLMEVQRLLDQGLTGKEISRELCIPVSTCERYVNTVYRRSKVKWEEVEKESLENRAFVIKEKYEKLAYISELILDDDSKSPKEKIEAGKTMIACHLNIYNMLKYGALKFPTVEAKGLNE